MSFFSHASLPLKEVVHDYSSYSRRSVLCKIKNDVQWISFHHSIAQSECSRQCWWRPVWRKENTIGLMGYAIGSIVPNSSLLFERAIEVAHVLRWNDVEINYAVLCHVSRLQLCSLSTDLAEFSYTLLPPTVSWLTRQRAATSGCPAASRPTHQDTTTNSQQTKACAWRPTNLNVFGVFMHVGAT